MAVSTGGCINHPGIESIARCKMCGKGVCNACCVKGPTGNFCSAECKEKHEEFVRRTESLERKTGSSGVFLARLRSGLGTVIVFTLLAFAVGFAARFFDLHIPVLSPIVDRVLQAIGL